MTPPKADIDSWRHDLAHHDVHGIVAHLLGDGDELDAVLGEQDVGGVVAVQARADGVVPGAAQGGGAAGQLLPDAPRDRRGLSLLGDHRRVQHDHAVLVRGQVDRGVEQHRARVVHVQHPPPEDRGHQA